ncbi:unnamed protein product [Caenorhabditis sp. 36 PRJEB53466]|nr:unnamed protein product [Caenorhabditis sp. 36 PRJEB53466]
MVEGQSKDLIAEKKAESGEKSELHLTVEKYIGERFEVYMTDGRIVRGTLLATDKDANMIFNKADERWSQNSEKQPRYLGQAMISKKYVSAMYELPSPKETEI